VSVLPTPLFFVFYKYFEKPQGIIRYPYFKLFVLLIYLFNLFISFYFCTCSWGWARVP